MTMRRLAEVADVDSGTGFPLTFQGMQGCEFPFLKVSDMNLKGNERAILSWNNTVSNEARTKLRARAFPAGALIFPKIGAAIGTNKKRQLIKPSCVDNNVMAVVPRAEYLDQDFLYYRFIAKDLSDFASDSNPPSIRKTAVEDWLVDVPPMWKQRRIVDLLTRAEGIVRLRREAEKKAAELIPALFLEVFGDPATNPKGWANARLGDLVDEFRYGTSQKSGASGFPVLRIPNVVGGGIDVGEIKTVQISDAEVNRLRVLNGDILFVRTNGNPDYVGRSAVFDREVMARGGYDGANTVYASYLIRARLHADLVEPLFLQAYLSSSAGRARLREQCRTSAGQYNINTEGLASVFVPVPHLDLQKEFVKKMRGVAGLLVQQSAATAKAQATFDALLAQTFNM